MDMYDLPKPVHVSNLPDAESLRERIKRRESSIRADLRDTEDLIVEYHAPTGLIVRVRDVGYYPDSDHVLVLAGWDAVTSEECQIMAPVNTVQLVFRVIKIEDGRSKRNPIGFFRADVEEEGTDS